jgi:hypothetical protein
MRQRAEEATVDEEAFRQRLAAVMQRLAGELGATAVVRHDGNDWEIQPERPAASPLWVAGDNAWTLTVGFGRASACIELGYSHKADPQTELEELEAVCRAVIGGRLVERRKRADASRWRLVLGDGTILRGSASWLLPALPWTWIDHEQFAPYAGPEPTVDASAGTSMVDRSEDFGIPASARVSHPHLPTGADYAAVGALSRAGVLDAYVLITVRAWTERGRGVPKRTRQLPDVLMVKVGAATDLPEHDDGILVEEDGDDDYALLRAGQLRWSGMIFQLRWIPWPESQPILERYFA